MKKITISGAGAFGYAIALVLGEHHKDLEISLYDINEDFINSLIETKKHPVFYKNKIITDNIKPTFDLSEALKDVELIITAVPVQFMRAACRDMNKFIKSNLIILHLSKALEATTNKRVSEIIEDELKDKSPIVAALGGGMIAGEVATDCPVGADVGCKNEEALKKIKSLFLPTNIHVDTTTDIAGVEFAGSFKNVLSIGGGIIDGLGYKASVKSFFLTQAGKEIIKIASFLGADSNTFHSSSQSWMGDLMTSSFGNSRNRWFGELLGKGDSLKNAEIKAKNEGKTIEGIKTLESLHKIVQENKIEAPFLERLYSAVMGKVPCKEAFKNLARLQLCMIDKE